MTGQRNRKQKSHRQRRLQYSQPKPPKAKETHCRNSENINHQLQISNAMHRTTSSNILDRPLGRTAGGRYDMFANCSSSNGKCVSYPSFFISRVNGNVANHNHALTFQDRTKQQRQHVGRRSCITQCICLHLLRTCSISPRPCGKYIGIGKTIGKCGVWSGFESA